MVITLVVLVVLLIGAMALLRSSDSSTALAGQLGFRRDLKNQAERALTLAIRSLKSGDLATATARQSSAASANYSAARLETDGATGLPSLLLGSDSAFTGAGYHIAIVDADGGGANAESGVTVRYLIDRQCPEAGAVDESSCSRTSVLRQNSGQDTNSQMASTAFRSSQHTIYRISVRVDGPRGTQAFVQSAVAL